MGARFAKKPKRTDPALIVVVLFRRGLWPQNRSPRFPFGPDGEIFPGVIIAQETEKSFIIIEGPP